MIISDICYPTQIYKFFALLLAVMGQGLLVTQTLFVLFLAKTFAHATLRTSFLDASEDALGFDYVGFRLDFGKF